MSNNKENDITSQLMKHKSLSNFCGLMMPNGWLPLISELHANLLKIDNSYVVDQVKEKFGELRFYATPSDKCLDRDQFYRTIGDAERASVSICTVCGNAGREVTIHGWMNVLCDIHNDFAEGKTL